MNNKQKIYAMIPVRIGSQRLKYKNLALINGKPLVYYAIKAAKDSGLFHKIIINSDHKIFAEIAKRFDIEFYLRPNDLGLSTTNSDDVVADFMIKNQEATEVCWVNSIAPLQTGKEIIEVVKFFYSNQLDSLITVEEKQVHCMYNKSPINFSFKSEFALTQNLTPINAFSYTLMIWKSKSFLKSYKKHKYAMMNGKFGFCPVSKFASQIIKDKEDLIIVQNIMKSQELDTNVKYDNILKNIL